MPSLIEQFKNRNGKNAVTSADFEGRSSKATEPRLRPGTNFYEHEFIPSSRDLLESARAELDRHVLKSTNQEAYKEVSESGCEFRILDHKFEIANFANNVTDALWRNCIMSSLRHDRDMIRIWYGQSGAWQPTEYEIDDIDGRNILLVVKWSDVSGSAAPVILGAAPDTGAKRLSGEIAEMRDAITNGNVNQEILTKILDRMTAIQERTVSAATRADSAEPGDDAVVDVSSDLRPKKASTKRVIED